MSSKDKSFKNIVVIDSNFILLPFQFKIDFLHEINLSLEGMTAFIIFQQVFNELEAKSKREKNATKFQRHFNSGKLYIEKNKEKYDLIFKEDVKNIEEITDDFLLRKAVDLKKDSNKVFIATNDQDLKRKARKANVGVIFLRQKKYLSIERS